MQKTIFHVKEMDCPSEESLIRMKLDGIPEIVRMDIDIQNRTATIYHKNRTTEIENALNELKLGSSLVSSEHIEEEVSADTENKKQKRILWTVLLINFGFFVIEITTGLISRSMGLVADSLDMLADSFVYAISLFAVGKTVSTKKNVARMAGYFQILLALIGLVEVTRRFIFSEALPDFQFMIGISVLALIANGICLYILQKSKSNEAHMKASMIFTSNDIIINLGVIASGVLVYLLSSAVPDLVIGIVVFIIVIRGALRILKLAK
ncbi:cation transporter [Petrimonas sp.]|uniref:cation transporter n=1 Tax=Petrimonas sp. TaxID=2023866 RepID=UPI003F514313